MAVDLSAYSASVGEKLEGVKSQFKDKLGVIQDFITSYTEYSGVNDIAHDPIDIIINPVTALNSGGYNLKLDRVDRPAGLDANQPAKYKTHVWEAWQIDGLENKVMNLVTTSDTGILKELSGANVDINLQEAMYNYQRTNDVRDLEFELDALDGKWAADGYVLPPDALVHNRSWLIARFDEKRTDRTRNIYSEISKLAQQNVQWAYENGIKIEALHSDFAIQYAKIYKDIIDAIVTIYKTDVEMALARLDAEIKHLNADIEIAKLNITHDDVEMKLKVEQSLSRFKTYVDAYNTAIGANVNTVNSRITAATNIAEGYKAIFNAHGGQYTGISLETKKV
jgi:hypothetical protein